MPCEHKDSSVVGVSSLRYLKCSITILVLCASVLLPFSLCLLDLKVFTNNPVYKLYIKIVLPHATKASIYSSQKTASTLLLSYVGVYLEITYFVGAFILPWLPPDLAESTLYFLKGASFMDGFLG